MKKIPSLGEQEMQILRFISEGTHFTVRDVAEHFEKEKGLARTTILTVMERLRKKGLLGRTKIDGVFQYSIKVEQSEIMQDKVSHFIEQTLGGSVSPLFNYLFNSSKLTEKEMQQLKEIAEKLEGGQDA